MTIGQWCPREDDQEVTFPGGGRVPTGPQLQTPHPTLAGTDMGSS